MTTSCNTPIDDRPNALQCTRPAGHHHGHVYIATWAPDGTHDDHTHEED